MTLHRLLYRSALALEGGQIEIDRQILAIIERSRAANAAADVTGALLFASGLFIQALEGPLVAVETIFERICGDLRHRDVRLIEFTAVKFRNFPEWSMAAVSPDGDLMRLCASVDAVAVARADPLGAAATIRLMRSLVVADGPAAARERSL